MHIVGCIIGLPNDRLESSTYYFLEKELWENLFSLLFFTENIILSISSQRIIYPKREK